MVRVLRAAAAALFALLCTWHSPAAVADEGEDPVVVVGFSGMLWRDINPDNTPNLNEFIESAAGANMVVRTVDETTCPSEGWLTIGAGQRAIDPVNGCQEIGNRWDDMVQSNESSSYRADLGLLGQELADQDLAAIGPGAELALTQHNGEFAGERAEDFTDVADSDLVAVDLGNVRYPGDELTPAGIPGEEYRARGPIDKFLAAFQGIDAPPPEVEPQIAAVDQRFGDLMKQIEKTAPNARILVTSVADAQVAAPQLGFMAVRDGANGGGASSGASDGTSSGANGGASSGELATSDATRQPGLVQLTDVYPTLISWLEPDSSTLENAVGSPIRADGQVDDTVSRLADDQERSEYVRPFVGPFYVSVLVMAGLAGIAAWRILRRPIGAKVPRWFSRVAAWISALPVASLLINAVPWWRFVVPGVALFAGMALIAGVIVALAYALPRRDKVQAPVAIIGAITAGTLMVDVLVDPLRSGYSLQLASLLGTQPQVGGRFYGLSNASFAIMTAGILLAVSYVVARLRRSAGLVVLVGVAIAVILIDGMSTLGADFGGPPALVVGFVLAGLLLYGVRLSPPWVIATLVAGGLTSLLFSFVDYLRPAAERSHLGRFIQTATSGGGFEVITRKLSQSLFGLPWWLAVAVFALLAAGAIVWWYRRTPRPVSQPQRLGQDAWRNVPLLRHTTFPVIAALVFGMVINDSGVVIPAIGLTVAGLLWVASANEYSA